MIIKMINGKDDYKEDCNGALFIAQTQTKMPEIMMAILRGNIATAKTSQAITSFHFLDYFIFLRLMTLLIGFTCKSCFPLH